MLGSELEQLVAHQQLQVKNLPMRKRCIRLGFHTECALIDEGTSPLLARASKPAERGPARPSPAAGFFEVLPANVVLVNAKRAEDGHGIVLRLFETAGRKVDARVKCGFQPAGKARLVRLTEDLAEGPQKALPIDNATIPTQIGPFEIQTIRIGP